MPAGLPTAATPLLTAKGFVLLANGFVGADAAANGFVLPGENTLPNGLVLPASAPCTGLPDSPAMAATNVPSMRLSLLASALQSPLNVSPDSPIKLLSVFFLTLPAAVSPGHHCCPAIPFFLAA